MERWLLYLTNKRHPDHRDRLRHQADHPDFRRSPPKRHHSAYWRFLKKPRYQPKQACLEHEVLYLVNHREPRPEQGNSPQANQLHVQLGDTRRAVQWEELRSKLH